MYFLFHPQEYTCECNSRLALLDIITIPLDNPHPVAIVLYSQKPRLLKLDSCQWRFESGDSANELVSAVPNRPSWRSGGRNIAATGWNSTLMRGWPPSPWRRRQASCWHRVQFPSQMGAFPPSQDLPAKPLRRSDDLRIGRAFQAASRPSPDAFTSLQVPFLAPHDYLHINHDRIGQREAERPGVYC